MTGLYDTLGVPPDATPEEIKAAYKRKAKETHPDAGGDAAKFQQVTLAHRILSDSEKRAKYDETGSADEDVDTIDTAALAIIGGLVEELTQQIVTRDDLQFVDLAKQLRGRVKAQEAQANENLAQARKFEKKAVALRKRFKAKKGPDYIGNMLDGKVAACRGAIRSGEDHLARLKRAAEILDDVDYQVDKRADANQFGYGTAGQAQSILRDDLWSKVRRW